MSFVPKPHEIYKHFKGNLYQIVAIATHSESGEELVIYQAMYGDFKTYARPLEMFISRVDKEKYPDAEQEFRFELQGEGSERQRRESDDDRPVQDNAADSKAEIDLDPLVLEFLDADTYAQKLNILAALHHRITDDMINTMAIASDVEVDEGDIEKRFKSLKNCLLMKDKYETNRLR